MDISPRPLPIEIFCRKIFSTISKVSTSCWSFGGRIRSFLNRYPDQITPFRPAAVVVAHALEAEQVLEREPRVAAALADAAVRDRFLLRRQLLVLLVQFLQL